MRSLAIAIVVFFGTALLAQQTKRGEFQNIEYLYYNADGSKPSRIIVHVPGFTEHSRIPESFILQTLWKERGYSFLVMDPPQHAEGRSVFETGYSWGEQEPATLKALMQHLDIWQTHNVVHILGFSIGAKIALQFAGMDDPGGQLASVVAVAAPYTVQDINMRLSGDILKPHEGLISGFYAVDRVGVARMLNMVLVGMNRHMLSYSTSPAKAIGNIDVPLLFIHGVDDWLTKSYHSKHLAALASHPHQTATIQLDTRTHSADMISRDHSDTRAAFLEALMSWFSHVEQSGAGTPLNAKQFLASLEKHPKVYRKLYKGHVTSMTSPSFLDPVTQHWIKAADLVYAPASVGYYQDENSIFGFFSLGHATRPSPFQQGWEARLHYQKPDRGETQWDAALSWHLPNNGLLLRIRRLTLAGSLNDFENRRFAAIDLAYLILDFQLAYGRFYGAENDLHFHMNWPMIGNASGSYFLGTSYSQFLTRNSFQIYRNSLKFYLHAGPRLSVHNTQLQLTTQYDLRGDIRGRYNQFWGFGLNINIGEH